MDYIPIPPEATEQSPRLSRKTIGTARHRAELPLYTLLAILNISFILLVAASFAIQLQNSIQNSSSTIERYQHMDEEEFEDRIYDYIYEDDYASAYNSFNLLESTKLLLYVVAIFVIFVFSINLMYAQYKSQSVRITPWNFPEVYQLIESYCKRLGMTSVPEAYIFNGNGIMNAFSAFVINKKYLTIEVDLFEIAYREHHDMDTLGFVIAHELSHIYYRHVDFKVQMGILFSASIPILGSVFSRAREYSCDRLAQAITENDGVEAMLCLMAGKHLYKDVDVNDYLWQASHTKGFFCFIYNLISSHPIMPKRILTLARKKGSGPLF